MRLPNWIFRRAALLALGLFVAPPIGCAPAGRTSRPEATRPPAAGDVAVSEQDALAEFDAAWQIIHDRHFDPKFNGVDWLALRDELRPKVQAARTLNAVRSIIRDMLGRLGQSHFGLLPREVVEAFKTDKPETAAAATADVGLDVRLIDKQIVVWWVDAGSPGELAGVRPGWIVLAIDDDVLAERIAKLGDEMDPRAADMHMATVAGRLMRGDAGTQVRLKLLDGQDRPTDLELARRPNTGTPTTIGDNFPTVFARLESGRTRRDDPPVDVGWIRFNFWFLPVARPFDEALDTMRDADGIIIDLRGNGGGALGLVMGVSGHFLDARDKLGTMKTREMEIKIIANPRRVDTANQPVRPYAGPLAVLIDHHSASASELFAGGMQSIGRARVFGQTSMGAALPAVMPRLPNGDVLYHAFADFVDAQGTRLEARGVLPDEPIELRREDLLAGKDAAFDAALGWIAKQKAGAKAGTDDTQQ